MTTSLWLRAQAVFAPDTAAPPVMSLRGGNALDGYAHPPPFDASLDEPTDKYLENNYWGVAHLDPASWRHYLPRLIRYADEHKQDAGAMVIDALLWSLRPPDRDPPRFASLSPEQEAVVVAVLDVLAFDADSEWKDLATVVLEEYWVKDALYRK